MKKKHHFLAKVNSKSRKGLDKACFTACVNENTSCVMLANWAVFTWHLEMQFLQVGCQSSVHASQKPAPGLSEITKKL